MFRLITIEKSSHIKTIGKPMDIDEIINLLVFYQNNPHLVKSYWLEWA